MAINLHLQTRVPLLINSLFSFLQHHLPSPLLFLRFPNIMPWKSIHQHKPLTLAITEERNCNSNVEKSRGGEKYYSTSNKSALTDTFKAEISIDWVYFTSIWHTLLERLGCMKAGLLSDQSNKMNNLINNPTLHIWAWAQATDRHCQTYVKNCMKCFNAWA